MSIRGGFKFKGVTFTCDCPDFTGQHSRTIQGIPFLRDWAASSVGAIGTKGEACKHIWATMLALKLVDKKDVPKDVPQPVISVRSSSSTSRSFTPLGILGFKPYRGG